MPNNSVKVFIMSWNMGNAEQVGMKNVLDERDATADYDIIVIGLQESTYAIKGQQAADSIAHLGKQIQDMVGEKYYLVSSSGHPKGAPPSLACSFALYLHLPVACTHPGLVSRC